MSKLQRTTTASTHQSTDEETSIFHPGLLGPGMTIDKNMNSGLIHIPGGKL
jgi:hypothetical protein